jgi:transposase
MISASDRHRTVTLIQAAMAAGATQASACETLGLSPRTYQRWTRQGEVQGDGRPVAQRRAPANKLSGAERSRILEVCNCPEFASKPPAQIVPALADTGVYLASESSFYRVLRDAGQVQHRGTARAPMLYLSGLAHGECQDSCRIFMLLSYTCFYCFRACLHLTDSARHTPLVPSCALNHSNAQGIGFWPLHTLPFFSEE